LITKTSSRLQRDLRTAFSFGDSKAARARPHPVDAACRENRELAHRGFRFARRAVRTAGSCAPHRFFLQYSFFFILFVSATHVGIKKDRCAGGFGASSF